MIQLGCQMAALTVAAGQEDRCDMLLVVRHADAGDKGSWDGPDVGRPLSPEGRRQAEGLVVRLEDYPVDRILCSPTVRCHQTVQPMASDRLLEIEAVAALGVDAGPDEVLALFWDRRLRNAVLCTHGETIGGCCRSSPPTGWSPQRRCNGPRAQPGCCSAPHRHRSGPAIWRR
jgi:Histidine phosphatase superfamily (branch 1)